ncbi:MAG TPA: HAD-IA family hydrolase [Actinopolymorphaceae bacterium]|nr:HAD-IA family hydrolase [Actinopolymorphaceae bacterium]
MTTTSGTTPHRSAGAVDLPEFAVDAVLLDLDGTLVDSASALVRTWSRWAAEHSVTPDQMRAVVAHGLTAAALVAALLPAEQVAAGLARIDELEIADVEDVTALAGSEAFVSALPVERWAIVTSGNRRVAEVRLEAAGLVPPPVMVTADDVCRGKPDPEPFLLGAARLDVAPSRCLVVEDSPAGLAAARAAGMATVGVTTTHPARDLHADHVVEGLQNLRVDVDGGRLTIGVTGTA